MQITLAAVVSVEVEVCEQIVDFLSRLVQFILFHLQEAAVAAIDATNPAILLEIVVNQIHVVIPINKLVMMTIR